MFYWGAATASYQIEGDPLADGAAPSVWHEYSHRRGRIKGGGNGDVACAHYRLWPADVKQMARLGLSAYRFSVAWPRVCPEPGRVNPRGLDFYSRLVDALLEEGIEPFVTLFHWDTPSWAERAGGFLRRETLEHLLFYGEAVARALGDRVRHWITINEPVGYAMNGYLFGKFPPGRRLRLRQGLHAAHHLLLGHSRLVRMLHERVPRSRVGIANHFIWVLPLRPEDQRDRAAAERMDQLVNGMYLDPLVRRRYPAALSDRFGWLLPRGWERDLEEMRLGDYLGINYYESRCYRHAPLLPLLGAVQAPIPGGRRTMLGTEVAPEGLYRILRRLQTDYGNPEVLVTESGTPLPEPSEGDPLDDTPRIEYLDSHIRAALRARREGARLGGYFVWSLLDNFEWDDGYAPRFGLLRVDYATQERQWRRSAAWYRDLIRSRPEEAP